jgi:ATP-dependent RNA helicase DBP3
MSPATLLLTGLLGNADGKKKKKAKRAKEAEITDESLDPSANMRVDVLRQLSLSYSFALFRTDHRSIEEPTISDRKKEKKRKRLVEEPSAGNNAEPASEPEKKKKKKKDRKGAEVSVAPEDDETMEDPAASTSFLPDERPSAKVSKKERKHRKEKQGQVADDDDDDDGGPAPSTSALLAPPDAKKSKKDKKAQKGNASGPSEAAVAAFRAKHAVSVHGSVAPVLAFDQLAVPDALRRALDGFAEPTPIQAFAWPPALEGRDVVGIAETGR